MALVEGCRAEEEEEEVVVVVVVDDEEVQGVRDEWTWRLLGERAVEGVQHHCPCLLPRCTACHRTIAIGCSTSVTSL